MATINKDLRERQDLQERMSACYNRLTESGADEETIAARLLAAECYGTMGDPYSCPIAAWFKRCMGPLPAGLRLSVSKYLAYIFNDNEATHGIWENVAEVRLMGDATNFISQFDRGFHPELRRPRGVQRRVGDAAGTS